MGLEEYAAKRRFDKTPEPEGEAKKRSGPLTFVVQQHDASRMHFDFRLELDGVLKSWAVPKGPSMNPADKRLAIMTEDHPLDYGAFEGVIPAGNYGAGTVLLWDSGTYSVPGVEGRDENEETLRAAFRKGRLSIRLEGKKLRGEYSLFRLKRNGENEWLLVKKDDEHASEADVLEKSQSVASGRELDEIAEQAAGKGELWDSEDGALQALLESHPTGRMPTDIAPMLATIVDDAFDDDEWIFEIKWDGYRTIAELDDGSVNLYSRNGKSFNAKYPSIVESLEKIPGRMVLDGELVAVDEHGKSVFQWLQNYGTRPQGNLVYYVFDLLYFGGHILTNAPLLERKQILRMVLPDLPDVLYSDHISADGTGFLKQAEQAGLEGIIAKKITSPYRPGRRSRDWLKIKIKHQQEAVIGGYTAPQGSRKHFGSLILGAYQGDRLIPIGQVGTGFSDDTLKDLKKKLSALARKTSPFARKPETSRATTWVSPKLVCEVSFSEWTSEGSMRHPVFLGLRDDKDPKDVVIEREAPVEEVVEHETAPRSSAAERHSKASGNAEKPAGDRQLTINRRNVKVTNLDKLFWADEDLTKWDLIQYYRSVAKYILPHLKDRLQSLHRHPNGWDGDSFFQKDVGEMTPDWIELCTIRSESGEKDITYMLCQDEAALVYMANLGCIELNPWLSRKDSFDRPDFSVIDLDPVDVSFSEVVEVAQAVRDVLEEFSIEACCKTSGSKGIHIYIPLGARHSYEQSRTFAELLSNVVHHRIPRITSLERSPSRRKKKVYLDYLQNSQGQTIAAPYCLRPRAGAPVSAPLNWDELKPGLNPSDFNIHTMTDRLKEKGDLFAPVLSGAIDLHACLERMAAQEA